MEHVYVREMFKAKTMARGLQKKQCKERFLGGKGTKRCRVKEMGAKTEKSKERVAC